MKLTELNYDSNFDESVSKQYLLCSKNGQISFCSLDSLRSYVDEFITAFPSVVDDDSYSIMLVCSYV